ncbi:hypothetical protein PG993_003906 [Apiospora rasikravindrae]|uniref:Uncharacterized protein n=1 Tax=Apiospora rasikravindrae TaxID=990691 RepID=A0ABR1U334_9PEZI
MHALLRPAKDFSVKLVAHVTRLLVVLVVVVLIDLMFHHALDLGEHGGRKFGANHALVVLGNQAVSRLFPYPVAGPGPVKRPGGSAGVGPEGLVLNQGDEPVVGRRSCLQRDTAGLEHSRGVLQVPTEEHTLGVVRDGNDPIVVIVQNSLYEDEELYIGRKASEFGKHLGSGIPCV